MGLPDLYHGSTPRPNYTVWDITPTTRVAGASNRLLQLSGHQNTHSQRRLESVRYECPVWHAGTEATPPLIQATGQAEQAIKRLLCGGRAPRGFQ